MAQALNVLFIVLGMLVLLVAEHRNFPVSFALAFACVVAAVVAADRFPQGSRILRKRNVLIGLWLALIVSFAWEADTWAREGKPSQRLFGQTPHSAA